MQRRSILACVPAFDEDSRIADVVLGIRKHVDMVVVVDDGSKDKTSSFARAAGAFVVKHKTNEGYGAALKTIFQIARGVNADAMVIIDADGQHNPDEIPALLNPILSGRADIAIGSRFVNTKQNHIPKTRKLGMAVLNFLTGLIGPRVLDSQSGFRAYSRKALSVIDPTERGMGAGSEILIQANHYGLRVTEVPTTCRYDLDKGPSNLFLHGFGVLLSLIKLAAQNNNRVYETRKTRSPRICIVSFPMPSKLAMDVVLSRIVSILKPLSEKLYIITGNSKVESSNQGKIEVLDTKIAMRFRDAKRLKRSAMSQIITILSIQIKMCYLLAKISKKIDAVIFYMGGTNLFLPVLTARFMRKKVTISAFGRGSLGLRRSSKRIFSSFYASILTLLENTSFRLADKIIVESNIAVRSLYMAKYARKLVNCSPTFVDTNRFNTRNQVGSRENVIGYVGRISLEKGVMNFVRAIPLILQKKEDVTFLIGGYGPLYQEIEEEIRQRNLFDKVKLVGWISHDNQLPVYLNMLKLLVLPSFSEGMPAIILEAMACGTLVLVTPVGGLPEIVKDGQTGFILKNNSPECIAESTVSIMEQGNFEEISENARETVRENFTYEAAVKKYKWMLGQLLGHFKSAAK